MRKLWNYRLRKNTGYKKLFVEIFAIAALSLLVGYSINHNLLSETAVWSKKQEYDIEEGKFVNWKIVVQESYRAAVNYIPIDDNTDYFFTLYNCGGVKRFYIMH